ncbi:MAG: M13 family metallopeptidase [Bacteroidaceae bacterium]|nr:M13 family metallopeptidase [Bacteroidaceae bacterium]
MKNVIRIVSLSLMLMGGATLSAQQLKGYDKENMNTAVKPGDNFVEYACGNWLKTHPLRDDQMTNGAFMDLYEENQKQIQEMILEFATQPQEKGSLGYKIGTIYNQMMDTLKRNEQGLAPIMPTLEKIRAIKDRKEYQRVTAEIDRRGANTMMFGWGAGSDIRDADNNIVSLSQDGLGLGTRDYYFNEDPQSQMVREAYKAYLKRSFMALGYDEATAAERTEKVYAIEKRIAEPSYDMVKLRDIDANYHKMTYDELVRDFPGIEWPTLFWVSGFPAFKELVVEQPEPLHEVEKILADTPLEDLKAYAEVRIIMGASSSLTQDLRRSYFTFVQALTGQPQDDHLWKQATGLVNGVLGNAIGKMYCEKYFPESSKQRMLTMVRNLQTALGQRIDALDWMGDATKAEAKKKLADFHVKIGYPDKWKDYSKMEIDEDLSLFENLMNVSEWNWLDALNRKVNKPVDKEEWHMNPQTINAYYNPTTNEICFPAGILQPPFFDVEADDAQNYGAIGGVIGHEMSHGFDDQGCQFDLTGNQRNWWTEADKAAFDKRAAQLADYFSTIEVVNGKKVNGQQTLGENIGDNGGLHVALQALHNTGNNAVIDGFTADQRFFLGWARVWASNNREQYMDMLLNQDVHSPNAARVNGALPQIDEWYDAFGIKKGKLFIPKNKRIRIW